ncbi:MAG: hypothetical protein AAF456_00190 [Planctomycetota bacterium]
MNDKSVSTTPVVLGHAPCTGGSLVFRIVTATFGWYGLSEIGVAKETRTNRYNPWDPEYHLYVRNELSPEQFGEVLFQRIIACEKHVTDSGKRLLVREHTHSFLFEPADESVVPEGGSWFVDMYRKRDNRDVPCIVSVRDPVDSWLSMRRAFENLKPDTFDEYCRLYNEMLDKAERANESGGKYLIFRYEDMLQDAQSVIDRIADHTGEARRQVDLSTVGKITGSGNSGRLSEQLQTRSRRPFTLGFLNHSKSSAEYRKLCERLNYETIGDTMTTGRRIRSGIYSGLSVFSGVFSWLESTARGMKGMLKSGKNIQ